MPVNFYVAIALGWSATARARVGMSLAGILLIPGLATLWAAFGKLVAAVPPAPLPMWMAALGAFAVNLSRALMLAYFRTHSGSLTRAAFISARNDADAAREVWSLSRAEQRAANSDQISG